MLHFPGWHSIPAYRNITLSIRFPIFYTVLQMFTHIVYFWMKLDAGQEGHDQFMQGAKHLLTIEDLAQGYVGKPADTEKRDIVDDSYDYALITIFDTIEAHDRYQVHPKHDDFRALAPLWERVQIYDSTIL